MLFLSCAYSLLALLFLSRKISGNNQILLEVLRYKHAVVNDSLETMTQNATDDSANLTKALNMITLKIGIPSPRHRLDWCNKTTINPVRHEAVMHLVASRFGIVCQSLAVEMVLREGKPSWEYGCNLLAEGLIDVYTEPVFCNGLMQNISHFYMHENRNLCLLVPKASSVRQSMLLTVSLSIWGLTVAILLLFVALICCGFQLTIGSSVFEVARTFLTGAFNNKQRGLLLSLSFLNFFMANTIAGSFTGSIVTPSRAGEMNTLEDVNASVSVIYMPWWYESVMGRFRSGNGIISQLARKTLPFKNNSYLSNVVSSPDKALVAAPVTLSLLERHPEASREGYSLLHRVRECMFTLYGQFPVRKDWQERDRVSGLLQRVVESGLVAKASKNEFEQSLRNKPEYQEFRKEPVLHGDPPVPVHALEAVHLREAFVMWTVGVATAVVVFGLELTTTLRKSQPLIFRKY